MQLFPWQQFEGSRVIDFDPHNDNYKSHFLTKHVLKNEKVNQLNNHTKKESEKITKTNNQH